MPNVALAGLASAPLAWLAGTLLGCGLTELAGVEIRQLRWIMLMGRLILLEAVLVPLRVWLVLAEQPPNATLLGGTIILSALVWHSLARGR